MCANYNGERRREYSRRKILSCFAIGKQAHLPSLDKKTEALKVRLGIVPTYLYLTST
jgi:hypothetical protein